MTTKAFHLGDILSVTTGRLVSPRHMTGIYDILGFMTGEDLFTDALPRACDECRSPLLNQHPDLIAVVVPEKFGSDEENAGNHVSRWLAEQVSRFGETRDVTPLADGDHTHTNPFDELRMIRPDAAIIPVIVPDEEIPA